MGRRPCAFTLAAPSSGPSASGALATSHPHPSCPHSRCERLGSRRALGSVFNAFGSRLPCPSKRLTTLGRVPGAPGAQRMPTHWPLGSRLTQPGPKLSPQVRSRAQPPVFCSFALCGPCRPHWAPRGSTLLIFLPRTSLFMEPLTLFPSTHTHTHTRPTQQSSWSGRGSETAVAICPSHTRGPAMVAVFGESSLVSLCYLFGVCVGSYVQHVALVPWPGIEPGPPPWEHGVLAMPHQGSPRVRCSFRT